MGQKTYNERKSKGLCVRCGKEKADENRVMCIYCLTKKRWYSKYKIKEYQSWGICPYCRKNKIMGDEKSCPECKAKNFEKRSKYERKYDNAKHNEYVKQKREKRTAQGLCPVCGKRKIDSGYKTCGICRAKNTANRRKGYESILEERIKNNKCRFCDNDVLDGYKVCAEHRERMIIMANLPQTKKARAENKRYWYK